MEIVNTIKTINDWKRIYPPAGKDKQWKDCYSAKEFAKIVTDSYPDSNFENEIGDKLQFNSTFHIIPEETYPERLTSFDNNYRGPRHHDLACIAEVDNKKIALCFEAKVNESLDQQLSKYRDSDGKQERVDSILSNFIGCKYIEDKHKNLYYQILSAVAGSIAFAAENNVEDVYFILYQIKPKSKNKAKNIQKHIDALNDFISLFPGKAKIDDINKFSNLGKLTIERLFDDENPDKGKMNANVVIAYIEREVSGK